MKVWWSPYQDRISRIGPYVGPLGNLFASKGGARIVTFSLIPNGCNQPLEMTIVNGDLYEILQP